MNPCFFKLFFNVKNENMFPRRVILYVMLFILYDSVIWFKYLIQNIDDLKS